MSSRVIKIDPFKCNGCKECETACAERHGGNRKIGLSRIHVMGSGPSDDGFSVPSTCQQCSDPPCMAVCPRNAIRRDGSLDRVVIDTSLCVGCTMCVSACPTGSMSFAHDLGLPFKCELCDGNPECVRVCEKKALEYTEASGLHTPRMRESAGKFLGALRGQGLFSKNQWGTSKKE